MDEANRDWYKEHCRCKETSEFVSWFTGNYGYDCVKDDKDEYWLQRIFALKGWLACRNSVIRDYEIIIDEIELVIEKFREGGDKH